MTLNDVLVRATGRGVRAVMMGPEADGTSKPISSVDLYGRVQVLAGVFDGMLKMAKPEDLATIIYTPGTTGQPKGVMLTHGNLASNINLSTGPLGFTDKDSCISFLPLSHVTARHLDYSMLCHVARLAFCSKFDQLATAMKTVKPTVFVAVPRVYEKIRQAVEGKSAASPVKAKILRWALETGKKHRSETLVGKIPGGGGGRG